MADLSSVTDNYLPTASETFTDNLSSSIAALATTVPVNSAVEYADGDTVVLTVDPGTANEATFVGKKDTGMNQFIECIWTEGNTAVGHDAGATIIDYDSATHFNLLSTALQGIMGQDGVLLDDLITNDMLKTGAGEPGGAWTSYTSGVSGSGTAKGNGTTTGYYTKIGRTVHVISTFTLGSTSTVGIALNFSVPAIDTSFYTTGRSVVGLVTLKDASTGNTYTGWGRVESSGVIRVILVGTTGQHTATSTTAPFTWTTGDTAEIEVTYLSS